MARDLEAENRQLRNALAEVRVHARLELKLVRPFVPDGARRTLEAIVATVDQALGHSRSLVGSLTERKVG